jgi:hypothetical protein
MKVLAALGLVVLLTAVAGGCGDSGFSEEELALAKQDAFAQGKEVGYADGLRDGKRQASKKRIAKARDKAFDDGIAFVLGDLQPVPGQDYAIAFAARHRGLSIRDSLPMKPGLAYECPPQSPYCTVSSGTGDVPAASSEPAPADPCDPHYPNVCLDPDATDYDCAGSGDDGPEYVEGPVRILNGDPFDLDGYPPDGLGCDRG